MGIDSSEQKVGIVEHITPWSREFYQFLLGDSENSQQLSLDDLRIELEIVASGNNLTDKERDKEVARLKKECRSLAEELAKEYSLDENDLIALKDVLLGLSQADFLNGQKPYNTAIFPSRETGYLLDKQHNRERLNASPKLFDIIMKIVLDRVALLEDGVQLRMSSNPSFCRSAAIVYTIIDKNHKGTLFYSPKFIEISPLHKISEDYEKWVEYRNNVRTR